MKSYVHNNLRVSRKTYKDNGYLHESHYGLDQIEDDLTLEKVSVELKQKLISLDKIERYTEGNLILPQYVFYVNAKKIIIFLLSEKRLIKGIIVNLVDIEKEVYEVTSATCDDLKGLHLPSTVPIMLKGSKVLSKILFIGGELRSNFLYDVQTD